MSKRTLAATQEEALAPVERRSESDSHYAVRNRYSPQGILREGAVSEQEFAAMLTGKMREIAQEVFREAAHDYLGQANAADDAAARLREQIALIKAKENITIKEAALLLSCSESHIRKLVKLALKGKSRRPIPSVPMEGVTVFPLRDLLDWASPKPQPEGSLK